MTTSELQSIKSLVDFTYSMYGNSLKVVENKIIDLKNPELGYCYKDVLYDGGEERIIYNIYCSPIGNPDADFRIKMHEYGHIYLGHLDGIHEAYDRRICKVFEENRGELIETINKECGIDFADKLIERVIDDPVVNHSIHNIAMDMEINSKLLDLDDIKLMQDGVTDFFVQQQEKEMLSWAGEDEEKKKLVEEATKKARAEGLIKFIHPSNYHMPDGTPFESGLSYPEYLIQIILHLDQFVKMLVSISMGGTGNTSNISSEDVRKALEEAKKQNQNQQGENQQSGGDMQGLDQLMQNAGMSDGNSPQQKDASEATGGGAGSSSGNGKEGQGMKGRTGGRGKNDSNLDSPYSGTRDDSSKLNGDEKTPGGTHKDHFSKEREDADVKREKHEISSSGGAGCGSEGGPDNEMLVKKTDEVDMAIDEVIKRYKNKVLNIKFRRDMMENYNRGINRSVIAPTLRQKVSYDTEPKIVFLIDVSGSMDTSLIKRILSTISTKMKKIGRGLHYDIISWSTCLGEHIRDISPRKPVTSIRYGGGTRMARGIEYFRQQYDENAILILISDFDDCLDEWSEVEKNMSNYTLYGFNYGYYGYNKKFKNMIVKNFNKDRNGGRYY